MTCVSINLLPEEYRRRERTPVRIFAATLAASVVLAGLGAALAYVRFGKLVSTEATLARLQEDKQTLEPAVKHHAALESEVSEYDKWRQTIRDVRTSRIAWSAKLDQFIDLVSQSGDQGRYLVWFTDLAVNQTPDSRGTGGMLEGKGVSGSDDVAKVAAFLSDLRRSDFFADFSAVSAPEGKVSETDMNLVPSAVWEFPMKVTIAPRDPKKAAPAPAMGTEVPASPSGGAKKPEAGK
jgi:Tfp pilus assembly protein PilN